jgi:hypothetical protein
MTAYSITAEGAPPRPRLVASTRLSADADFDRLAADLERYGSARFRARKVAFVAARQAAAPERIETRFNGKETENTATPGDWIVTNMDADRRILLDREGHSNTYVILAASFPVLYDRDTGDTEFGAVYKAKGVVDAVALPGGFDIMAPWGERQRAPAGYLVRNGADVYGIHGEAFEKTYERVA